MPRPCVPWPPPPVSGPRAGRRSTRALRTAATLIRDRADDLLAANAADVEAAERAGMAPGLLDRLRLGPERLADIATQLEVLAATPEPPPQRRGAHAAVRRAGVRAPGARSA